MRDNSVCNDDPRTNLEPTTSVVPPDPIALYKGIAFQAIPNELCIREQPSTPRKALGVGRSASCRFSHSFLRDALFHETAKTLLLQGL